jgi:hypothetical protein
MSDEGGKQRTSGLYYEVVQSGTYYDEKANGTIQSRFDSYVIIIF